MPGLSTWKSRPFTGIFSTAAVGDYPIATRSDDNTPDDQFLIRAGARASVRSSNVGHPGARVKADHW